MSKHELTMLLLVLLIAVSPVFAQKNKKSNTNEPAPIADAIPIPGIGFRSVGPALTSGRIADFAVNPQNRAEYYVAVASGGVWKTTNAGTSYTPIFDGQGSYSIGCIEISPNNPNIVWVGTGENNNQRSVAYGDGIYRSLDGGKSWKHMGLKNTEHIGQILIHPEDDNTIFVAAYGPLWSEGGERGIYKTTDGGQSWVRILDVDEHTGFNEIIMHPSDPNVLYAAAHQRRRHVFTYHGGGPESAIYRSWDGGKNWEKCTQGLPEGDKGRIGLAVSPADPTLLYAIIEAQEDQGGFFKSDDRGASWTKLSSYHTSGNYYQEIVCHPTDPNTIFAMDTWMHVSYDGGKTFKKLGEKWKHVDNHCLWIDPKAPSYFLAGCDGGVYESFDAGNTWRYHPNLPVTQFYKVEVDNATPFYNIYGGTQDNYSQGGPSRTTSAHGITNADWFVTHGGDGFETQIDIENPNIIYAQSQYGHLVRFDKSNGQEIGIQPKPAKGEPKLRWNWDAPLQVSQHKAGRLYFAANKLFRSDDYGDSWTALGDDLTAQIDRNALPVMGKTWSVDAVAKHGSTSQYGTIVAFHESPKDKNLLYVGTDDGLIQISNDGGSSWTKVASVPGVPDRTYVNMILASQHRSKVVYAAFNNHKNGDFKPYLYQSTDKGKTWTNISANLPERGSTYAIAEDHEDPNLLFVGTEFGVFYSNDGGASWTQIKNGVPTIAVRDLAIQKRENDLVIGTFGRGFYVLDDYSPLRKLKEAQDKEAYVFPIKKSYWYIENALLGNGGKGFMGESYYTAANPPLGATFTYWLKEEIKTAKERRQKAEEEARKAGKNIMPPSLTDYRAEQDEQQPQLIFVVKDEEGNIVRKLTAPAKKGVNRITWDYYYPALGPVKLIEKNEYNPYASKDQGAMASPGKYTVSMGKLVGDQVTMLVQNVPFEVVPLPGMKGIFDDKDHEAVEQFTKELKELNRQVSSAGKMLEDANNRLKYIRKAIMHLTTPSDALRKQVKAAEEKADQVKMTIYGDPLAEKLDKPSPFSVADRVGYLMYEYGGTTAKPTTTMKESLNIASAEFTPALEQLRELLDQDITALEQKLNDAKAPYTPGRRVEEED